MVRRRDWQGQHTVMTITLQRASALVPVLALSISLLVATPLLGAGQAPSQSPPSEPPPPQSASAPPATESYSYNPAGRRDPFVSLLSRGGDTGAREGRPEGREGLLISELTVRGIVRSRSAYVAMLQGPDNKTHIVRAGDQLLDGVIKAITADAVIFSQDVNDPLSLVKQREVRKALRGKEEGT